MIENTIKDYFSASDNGRLSSQLEDLMSLVANRDNSITSDLSDKELATRFRATDIPRAPQTWQTYCSRLTSRVLAHTIRTTHPRFMGHMTSQIPEFHQALSQMTTQLNQNVVKTETSRAITFLERQCIAMLHKLVFGCSEDFYQQHMQDKDSVLGLFVSGGTSANITALWSARNQALSPDSPNLCSDQGVYRCLQSTEYRDLAVVSSILVHYSVDKFASLSGIGRSNVNKIATNNDGNIDLPELQKTISGCPDDLKIFAVVAIAGSTETGSIDQLPQIYDITSKAGIHLHVDAAWGGPILFSKRHRNKLLGVEKADSVTLCGHKQLYLPQGVSFVLFRNPHLARNIATMSPYQAREDSYDAGRWTMEGSRPAVALFVDAALHLLGHAGYEYLIDYGIENAEYLAKRVLTLEQFELIHYPQSNIVVYRYLPKRYRGLSLTREQNYSLNRFNEKLQMFQYQRATSFISRTTLCLPKYGLDVPITVLRAVLANPNAMRNDIDHVLAEQIQIGEDLEATKYKLYNE